MHTLAFFLIRITEDFRDMLYRLTFRKVEQSLWEYKHIYFPPLNVNANQKT